MATQAKKEFLQTFEEIILKPRKMEYTFQFTGPTGTNAVEAALKIARQVTGRENVISFTHGFHGVSMGSLSVTANQKFRTAAGVALGNTTFMPRSEERRVGKVTGVQTCALPISKWNIPSSLQGQLAPMQLRQRLKSHAR